MSNPTRGGGGGKKSLHDMIFEDYGEASRSRNRRRRARQRSDGNSGGRSPVIGAIGRAILAEYQRANPMGPPTPGAALNPDDPLAQSRRRDRDYAQRQALIEQLVQQTQDRFQTDIALPAPSLIPLPDRAAYVKPFDDATAQANVVYQGTVPVLTNIYDDLAGALETRQKEATTAAATDRQQAAAEQSAMMQQAKALTAPTTLATELGATNGAAAEQAAADQAFIALRGADNAQVARELAAVEQEGSASRRQDAEAMRSGSLSTARTNLDQLLSQIGLGKAEAERQFAADTADVKRQNTSMQNEYATLKQQMEQQQLEIAQEREAMWADENERIAQTATVSPRMTWEANIQSRMQRYPTATQAMLDVIDEAGDGPQGMAVAMQLLRENGEVLSNGEMYGKKLNPRVIAQWLEEYYDENEYVDPQRYSQLGGDPTYLPVRDRYGR